MWVADGARGLGVGRRILAELEAHARRPRRPRHPAGDQPDAARGDRPLPIRRLRRDRALQPRAVRPPLVREAHVESLSFAIARTRRSMALGHTDAPPTPRKGFTDATQAQSRRHRHRRRAGLDRSGTRVGARVGCGPDAWFRLRRRPALPDRARAAHAGRDRVRDPRRAPPRRRDRHRRRRARGARRPRRRFTVRRGLGVCLRRPRARSVAVRARRPPPGAGAAAALGARRRGIGRRRRRRLGVAARGPAGGR